MNNGIDEPATNVDDGCITLCTICKQKSEENCRKCDEETDETMSQHPETCACHDCQPDLYE